MSKVTTLHGHAVPQTPTPNETLIAELERLLEAARAGEIVGLAGAYRHTNQTTSYSFAGQVGGYAMIGGIACLKQRLIDDMAER